MIREVVFSILVLLFAPAMAMADKYTGTMTTNVDHLDSPSYTLQSNIFAGVKKGAVLNFRFYGNYLKLSSKGYYRTLFKQRANRFSYEYSGTYNNCAERYITRVVRITSTKLSWYNSAEVSCADGGYLNLYQRMVMTLKK